jgi:hypothetical protein
MVNAFSGVFPICFCTAAIFVYMFIAPAFYGKQGFDDFGHLSSIGSIRVKAI